MWKLALISVQIENWKIASFKKALDSSNWVCKTRTSCLKLIQIQVDKKAKKSNRFGLNVCTNLANSIKLVLLSFA